MIVLLSIREWWLLLTRRRAPVLRETEPVWLPAYAIAEANRVRLAGLLPVTLALLKELSAQAHLERAQTTAMVCEPRAVSASSATTPSEVPGAKTKVQIYLEVTEHRFNGVTRCC
jgi:hypothetical protein